MPRRHARMLAVSLAPVRTQRPLRPRRIELRFGAPRTLTLFPFLLCPLLHDSAFLADRIGNDKPALTRDHQPIASHNVGYIVHKQRAPVHSKVHFPRASNPLPNKSLQPLANFLACLTAPAPGTGTGHSPSVPQTRNARRGCSPLVQPARRAAGLRQSPHASQRPDFKFVFSANLAK